MLDWHTAFNALSYTYGNCTQYLAGIYSWVGAHWGNGCQWKDSAKNDGLQISSVPVVGSIAVYDCGLPGSGGDGHVAKVESLNSDGSFNLSEVNWDGFNTVDVRKESLQSSTGSFIVGFILPPGISPTDTAVQPLGFPNPTDNLGKTLQSVGAQIQHDLFRVALSLLGFFVAIIGVGLLLSSEQRSKASSDISELPLSGGMHGKTASEGLDASKEVEGGIEAVA